MDKVIRQKRLLKSPNPQEEKVLKQPMFSENVNMSEKEKELYTLLLSSENSVKRLKEAYGTTPGLLIDLTMRAYECLTFEDKDLFVKKMQKIINPDCKNKLWQHNHVDIICSITNLTRKYNRFPSRYEISIDSKLSMKTVNKHIKEYFNSKEYNSKKDDYIIMRERVLASAFNYSLEGDMRAAKVFLDATNQFTQPPAITNQQNNYIQINGTVITQEEIKKLPIAKLNQVHKIFSFTNNKSL